jgi:hypothetical protein
LISIKAVAAPATPSSAPRPIKGCVMSKFDLLYLSLVLVAFGGFATALAYYSQRR